MVQAVITLGEHEDRVLNIVKGKYGLKNKSEAITLIIDQYEQTNTDIHPEYLKKLTKIRKKGYGPRFRSIEELRCYVESSKHA